MQHPFINDLSSKSLEELQEVISGLMSKLTFAYRTQNAPLVHQLNMAIESYKAAYSKKMDDMIQKQNIKATINIEKDS
jgi:predicted Zn-dependent protease